MFHSCGAKKRVLPSMDPNRGERVVSQPDADVVCTTVSLLQRIALCKVRFYRIETQTWSFKVYRRSSARQLCALPPFPIGHGVPHRTTLERHPTQCCEHTAASGGWGQERYLGNAEDESRPSAVQLLSAQGFVHSFLTYPRR